MWVSYVFWAQHLVTLDQTRSLGHHRQVGGGGGAALSVSSVLNDFLMDHSITRQYAPAAGAVFYTITIPESAEDNFFTARLVTEQIQQIADASVKQLFYVTTGTSDHALVSNTTIIQDTCQRLGLSCHNLGHDKQEAHTLSHLYKHCQPAQLPGGETEEDEDYHNNSLRVVTYIRSSPHVSHTDIAVNRRLRRILTTAALSSECLSSLQHTDQCNVCGLHFSTQWTLFYPGNMWTTTCQYINSLLEPRLYQEALEKVVGDTLVKRMRGDIMTNLYPDDKLGLGDSAMEHWIGSHPDLRPCEVGSEDKFTNYLTIPYSEEHLSWRQAPRQAARVMESTNSHTMGDVAAKTEYRLREYFLLPGQIMKWQALYGMLPTEDSWLWEVFPDGRFWFSATEKYGKDAVDVVVSAESMALPSKDLPSVLPNKTPNYSPDSEDLIFTDPQSDVTVFYDVYIPAQLDSGDVTKEVELIRQQVNSMSEAIIADSKIQVYYQTTGHESLSNMKLCADNPQLDCHLLHHSDERYESETIRQLSRFCQANPSNRVAYVHNQIPENLQQSKLSRDIRLLRALTMSAVSNDCFQPQDETCNLCGLVFQTQPYHGTLGNIWTARCDYVNELLPPHAFQERMQEYIGKSLTMELSGNVVMEDSQKRIDLLGLDAYGHTQWVGSHPRLVPCDLSARSVSYWVKADRLPAEFKFGMMPRKRNGEWEINKKLAEKTMDASLRVRSFQFLAGSLLKWITLYGEIPTSQWVWQTYPDGTMWSNATLLHGNNTVVTVTSQVLHK
jgi:hypothetical protein